MPATSAFAAMASQLRSLADSIRAKTGISEAMTIPEMASAVEAFDTGETFNAAVDGRPLSVLRCSASAVRPEAFIRHYSVESLDFPLCSRVGYSAFAGCSNLTRASFPNLLELGSSAFAGCSQLSEVYMPSLNGMYNDAFSGCSELASVDFPNLAGIGSRAFASCVQLSSASMPMARTVEASAFFGCTALEAAAFPAASSIGASAFAGCHSVSTAAFVELTSIASAAFQSCYRLTTLDLRRNFSIPLLANNAFASTPIGGYSVYAGGYGSILVPEWLYGFYSSASGWSSYRSRIERRGFVDEASVNAFPESVVLFGNVGMTVIAESYGSKGKDISLEWEEAGQEGFNLAMLNLAEGSDYALRFTAKVQAASFAASTVGRLGVMVSSAVMSSYNLRNAWYENIQRRSTSQQVELTFTATSSVMFAAFNMTAISSISSQSDRRSYVDLTDMAVYDIEW